jgi:beta-galactosidase
MNRQSLTNCQGWVLVCLAAVAFVSALARPGFASDSTETRRTVRSLDANWTFQRGDSAGAEEPAFDDSGWQTLDVPHDWSIAGPFDKQNPTGRGGAFLPAGVGWYRQHFSLPAHSPKPRVVVDFDGVMANSEVWINGHAVGSRPFGYVGLRYDLTDYVHFGDDEPNVLAVRVDNSKQPASRWYTGAGIYGHVRLLVTDSVHFAPAGVFVTIPQIDAERANVHLQMEVANQSDSPREVSLHTLIIDPAGRVAGTTESKETLPPQSLGMFAAEVAVDKPQLWNLSDPQLYRAVTRISTADHVVDELSTTFGIREFEFRADTGFWLNGQNFKLKGVCLHQDGGALGAAVPAAVWRRRLERLRELGVNSIRTAHNPPPPELLDLCDQLGFLVMAETFDVWTQGKARYDYHLYFNEWAATDARDMIRAARNHPSVILYCVGNEIRDTNHAEHAKQTLAKLVEVCHSTDPTRPVTQALFRPNTTHDYDNGLADMLDVIGTNYRDRELLAAWRAKPTRKIIGTEEKHGLYDWLLCRDHPQLAGQFLWVGVDYLGESPRWPITTFNGGLLDRTGYPYPRGRERQSWWSDQPMVAVMRRTAPTDEPPTDPGYEINEWKRRPVLFPDWTPAELEKHVENVEVYSNCDEVELLLNDKSLGTKPLARNASPRNWEVEF